MPTVLALVILLPILIAYALVLVVVDIILHAVNALFEVLGD